MSCGRLCCVVLCLLRSVPVDTAITQTPRHLVTATGSNWTLKCEQRLGHNAMYWYKQSAQNPPTLMFAYSYDKLVENDSVPSRFAPKFLDSSHLHLQVAALQPDDSAVYLCASSQDTALHSQLLPVHKPPGAARELWGRPRLSSASLVGPQTEISDHNAACQLAGCSDAQFPALTSTACGPALPWPVCVCS
uniref:Ig-like domain-containing protein n=1 Tax=Suricata suricatta TaxID=37032 RepID=A0A673SZT3_SURSU